MRIAVVDDNQYDLKKIILEIQKFEKSNHVKFYMQCFHRAEILCMELEENRVFDAYFLDIEMADMNGL